MFFKDIINKISSDFSIIKDDSKNSIDDIVINSKLADNKNIFVSIIGFNTDGHKYIIDAYKNGCRDFVVQSMENINLNSLNDSTIVKVNDSRTALGILSNYIFDYPFNKLKMIGITGTKGKTTVSTLLHHLIQDNFKSSLFTTINNIIGGIKTDSVRTTMESNELEKLLKRSLFCHEESAIVEVSSHAVTLKRIYDVQWDAGIFTSFSRDHLDLYGTMEKYFDAKLEFFKNINASRKKNKFVVINIDDPKGYDVVNTIDASVKIITVGKDKKADFIIKNHEIINQGLCITLLNNSKEFVIQSNLKGDFNVGNIALCIAAALELGIIIDIINERLKSFSGVSGRFEIVTNAPFTVIVDYAHTPQSIENILFEGRKLTDKKVIIVFGCTGERDKEKRPIMGEIAGRLSDFIVVTNDDTYNENPESIATAVEAGIIKSGKIINKDYCIILDRKKAIEYSLKIAKTGDVIILAGMGHEKYQILNNGQILHNDKETVLKLLQ